MTTQNVIFYEEQTGITGTSNAFVLSPEEPVNVACILTAGSPATGAVLQLTLDDKEKIAAGTANWVNSPLGYHLASAAESLAAPVTGIRLSASDGTWTLQARQK